MNEHDYERTTDSLPQEIPQTVTTTAPNGIYTAPVTPTTPTTQTTPYPNPDPYSTPVRPLKKEWHFKAHDAGFAALFLIVGLILFDFLFFRPDGIIVTALFLILLAALPIYMKIAKRKVTGSQYLLLGTISVFTLPFSLSDDALLHTLCALFLLMGIGWWVRSVSVGHNYVSRFFAQDLLDSTVSFPLNRLDALPVSFYHSLKQRKAGKAVLMILLGLAAALIPTLVIGSLLSSADEQMERLFEAILESIRIDESLMKFWFLILPTFYLYGLFYGNRDTKAHPVHPDAVYENKLENLRAIPNLLLYTSVTPILILYILYVASQLNYFLSAFSGTLPSYMDSYAAYARRGFFELCAIAIINLVILLIVTGCAKKGGKNAPAALKIYGASLCGFTLFIIATALAKMGLYVDAYGLTKDRLLTFWFMLLLAVSFIVLLIRQFRTLHTAKILTTVFLIFFGALCLIRPDALIAQVNLSRYESGSLKELDMRMLCKDLSDDAYMVMLQNIDIIEEAGKGDYFENALRVRQSDNEKSVYKILDLSSFLVSESSYADQGANSPERT